MPLKDDLQEIYECAASICRNADSIDTTGQLEEDIYSIVEKLKICIDGMEN